MVAALDDEAGRSLDGLETIVAIARFCTNPVSQSDSLEAREVLLLGRDGQSIRLLKSNMDSPHKILFAFRLSFSIRQYSYKLRHNKSNLINCGIPTIINALEMKDNDQ